MDHTGLVVRLFGGVELHGPLGATTLSGAKQRAIAARLALDAGRTVTTDQLIDSIWGEQPPQTVRASIQVHVSQVRRAMTDIGLTNVLVTRPAGYALEVEPSAVDVYRFEHLADRARAASDVTDHEGTLERVNAALALWRGPPLAGAGPAPFIDSVLTRLERVRLGLIPIATVGSIAIERVAELLPAVESLVADHPYDEPLWESLARLLYAQGRQADALDRLATVRRVLLEELGLDWSPSLAELEHQILTHAPALSTAAPVRRGTAVEGTGSKLPPLRSLIGRDALIAELVNTVGSAKAVTLTGPGGVGKTSVAGHVAAAVAAERRDGACFVDLTAIPADRDPLPAVAAALGMRSTSDGVSLDDVLGLLADREQLLVFDNCEHVLEGSASVVAAVTRCPGVQVVATSREPLGITDEVVIEVPPLSAADGAELFLRRAQSSVAGFVPDADEVRDLLRIAELVDGLPLALELASPLVRSLSPAQIVDELSHGRSLRSTTRAVEPRHSSMHDTVAWSYHLLDQASRTLFERLSVFEGGTDLSGVIEVCGDADLSGRVPRSQVVELLDGLIARSLVSVERTSSGMRYRMLVPVQRFATLMLDQSGTATEVRERHVRHVIEWLTENARVIESSDPAPGLAALQRASSNIRSAYLWCRQSGRSSLAADIVASFHVFAFRHLTTIPEVMVWVRESLLIDGTAPTTRMRILAAATLYLDQPPAASIDQARLATELAEELGDDRYVVVSRVALAHTLGESDNTAACRLLADTLARAATTSPVIEGEVAVYLCNHMLRAERRREVTAILDERMASGTHHLGLTEPELLYQRARLHLQARELDEAERLFRAVEASAHRTGSIFGGSFARFGFATLAYVRGDMERALARFQESLELDQRLDPRELWSDRMLLALAGARLGRRDIVEAQIEPLSGSQRPIVRAAHAIASACAARLNGFDGVAAQRLAEAAAIFAEMGSSTHLGLVFDEWALVSANDDLTRTLTTQSTELRAGSVDPKAALRTVETCLTGGVP